MQRDLPFRRDDVISFLFLGETLLIPHLYPIVEALREEAPHISIDLWVATSVHESLIGGWLEKSGDDQSRIRIRRAPLFRDYPNLINGENPPLPPKIPMLFLLAPFLIRSRAIVCAEQTSLWLPYLMPFFGKRFYKTSHGVGSMSARDDARRRAAYKMLVPSDLEKSTYLVRGFPETKLAVTGYVKSAFHGLARPHKLFGNDKPVIVYAPHWQRRRSSWWNWGREILDMLSYQDRFNVIFAPHQRLIEKDSHLREVLSKVEGLQHMRADIDSFAMVDGTYTAAADIYLGDTSSRVMEFLIQARPCVFLNPDRLKWKISDDHEFWGCGEVVEDASEIMAALERSMAAHPHYIGFQRSLVSRALGEIGPDTAYRAARVILAG